MASAYVEGVSVDRANESAAIVASHQRERFLGTINPSGPQPNPAQPGQPTGQLIAPSAYANPQTTVNASISSDPTPVITDGGGGGVVVGSTAASTVGATVAPTIAATNATPTTAAAMTTPTLAASSTATPTTAAIRATPATGTTVPTPTQTSVVTPSPTRAANPPLGTLRLSQAATTTTTTTTASSTTRATGNVVSPIHVVTNANGTVTVTNAPAAVITNHK
jgi:hypothetical protein